MLSQLDGPRGKQYHVPVIKAKAFTQHYRKYLYEYKMLQIYITILLPVPVSF